ncbi:unnamed protein product [Chrysodeixis includens]|uniref:Neurotransmitter-gated ion-channel ligand-binding domain-containing protein n=1 Tax=Chrysodeixis includens TaxID=689277 RepID=A0A9N8Q076_CHRIL|nr:unnamed protein product [Chrysodeixis includens]
MASRPAALLITLLLCAYGAPAWCACDNATRLSQQVDALLAEYEREAPPPDAPLTVTLGLDVRHAALDSQQSTMRLLADLRMTWYDPRLKWNATEWGCDSAPTSAWRLWRPDVAVLNSAAGSAADVWMRARLHDSGNVSWITRLDVTVPIALALADWPQDTQTCTFEFGSKQSNKGEILLEIGDFKHAVVFEAGPWEIVSVSGRSASWQRGEEEVSVAAWTVGLRRRAPAHVLGAAAVLLAGVLMLAAATALPPHQRHPLAACASFIAALWLITALLRLPGGRSCPRALGVMCALCVCGALAGACAALVVRVARLSSPPPHFLRALLSSLSTICRLTPSAESCLWSESGAWAAAARLADRVLCAALLLTLLVLLAVQLL